jgi:hypothetical protein
MGGGCCRDIVKDRNGTIIKKEGTIASFKNSAVAAYSQGGADSCCDRRRPDTLKHKNTNVYRTLTVQPATDEGRLCRFIASASLTGSKYLRGRITSYGKGRQI